MFLKKFSSTKSPWTKWCVFFLWMLLCLDLMARVETDMWVQRIVLMEFLKLNHHYNHRVSLLDHNVCCSVTKSCPTVFTLMDTRLPCPSQSPKFAQTHVHWVSDAIQLSHPLLPPSPPAFNLSQHHCLFQWVGSSHQVAKVLEHMRGN